MNIGQFKRSYHDKYVSRIRLNMCCVTDFSIFEWFNTEPPFTGIYNVSYASPNGFSFQATFQQLAMFHMHFRIIFHSKPGNIPCASLNMVFNSKSPITSLQYFKSISKYFQIPNRILAAYNVYSLRSIFGKICLLIYELYTKCSQYITEIVQTTIMLHVSVSD